MNAIKAGTGSSGYPWLLQPFDLLWDGTAAVARISQETSGFDSL